MSVSYIEYRDRYYIFDILRFHERFQNMRFCVLKFFYKRTKIRNLVVLYM